MHPAQTCTKEKTACFTGHRQLSTPQKKLEEELFIQIQGAIAMGYNHFICGGAVGFDTLAAERVIYARVAYKQPITLEIAVPCKNQDAKWSERQKRRYEAILEMADTITMVSENEYQPGYMEQRNKYMVDQSPLVIAYKEPGRAGGTKQTIEYAKSQGRKIWHIGGNT